MADDLQVHVARYWAERGLPLLEELIRIPSVSPAFDPNWEKHGFLDRAIAAVRDRARGMEAFEERSAGRTPALVLRAEGDLACEVLVYGHLDKQPGLDGWSTGLGPWEPVRRDERLFGRGSTDDGYATCVVLGVLEALERTGQPRPRVTLLLECGEESGSVDLPLQLNRLAKCLGRPGVVVVLDSEAGDYDRLWTTTSLRGTIVGTLAVEILTEGVHSGASGGIVPSAFGVVRHLLDRLDDDVSGVAAEFLCEPIPERRLVEAEQTARVLGKTVAGKFPWVKGARPLARDPATLLVNNTWKPSVGIIGIDGLPAIADAGATHRPGVALKLAIRIPPTLEARVAAKRLKRALERDRPNGARVRFDVESASNGWNAPTLPTWLERTVEQASQRHYGNRAATIGTGGTIPVVEMLGSRFPEATFLVTGVAGPHSNSHAPDESLHLPAARALTASLAEVLIAMGRQPA